jgi:hypothetical protein
MSNRLQILVDDAELERLKRAARRENTSVSEWVRRALRQALKEQAVPSVEEKLRALQQALNCNHPTADIDQMLKEIEAGRGLR